MAYESRDEYFSTFKNTKIQNVRSDNSTAETYFKLICNGAYMHIIICQADLRQITASEFPDLIGIDYLYLFDYDDGRDDYSDGRDSFLLQWILRPQCGHLFRQLTLPKPAIFYRNFQQYLNIPKFDIQLAHENGELKAILLCNSNPDAFNADHTVQATALPPGLNVPRIKAKSVKTVSRYNQSHPRHTRDVCANKVYVNREAYTLKTTYPTGQFLGDIKRLYSILMTEIPDTIRIARMVALVETDFERIAGVLLTYVPKKHTLWRAEDTDTDSNSNSTSVWRIRDTDEIASLEDRKKWFSQVISAVRHLHSAGVFWGNINPNNIIIDIHGDAWVVDFAAPVSHTEFVSWANRRNFSVVHQDGFRNFWEDYGHRVAQDYWENRGTFAADREGLRHLWEYLEIGEAWSLEIEVAYGFLPLTVDQLNSDRSSR